MAYVKCKIPEVVYHFTERRNLDSILADEKIRRYGDSECWFCRSIPDLLRYMEYTVMNEGKPYIAVGGIVKRYPAFVPEDYVVLKLTPRYREGNWFKWIQEFPLNSPPELIAQGKEFSDLKIGFRGDLRFKAVEVLDVSELLNTETAEDDSMSFGQSM